MREDKVIWLLRCSWFLKALPFAAPVAAAVFAVPFGHSFPLFPIGDDGLAIVNRFLERRRTGTTLDEPHEGQAGALRARLGLVRFRAISRIVHETQRAYSSKPRSR